MKHIQVFYLNFVFCLDITLAWKVQVLPSSPKTALADGPHWDMKTQSLYYCDLGTSNATLIHFDYRNNSFHSVTIPTEPFASFIIPIKCKPNQFAVGVARRVDIIEWDGYSDKVHKIRTAVVVEPENYTNTFNDGKADPCGRFYGGTERALFCKKDSNAVNASLYRYTKKSGLTRLVSNVSSSNGLTWDKRKKKFYYIDSCAFDIKSFDWVPKTGDIRNEERAYDFSKNGEFPGFIADGMTIDTDGNLWVGLFKGSSIVQINPCTHEILKNITIPAHQVTAGVFGGPNLDELFVTTAARIFDLQIGRPDTTNPDDYPLAGHLFKVSGLGARGFPGKKLSCI